MDTTAEEVNNSHGLEGEDVVGLDYIHIECKRVQNLNLYDAMEQSKRDSKEGQYPAVFHRKNNKKWLICLILYFSVQIKPAACRKVHQARW